MQEESIKTPRSAKWKHFEGSFLNRCLIFEVRKDQEGSKRYGGIAQLGEHLLCKQGVSGSIPLISTKYGLIAQVVRAHA